MQSGQHSLHCCIKSGNLELLDWLIGKGVPLEEVGAGSQVGSPLYFAISNGLFHVARHLVQVHGTSVNAPSGVSLLLALLQFQT